VSRPRAGRFELHIIMMVALASLVHFFLEHRSGNTRGVLEHQSASINCSSYEYS
jgi:hypothetical protein